MATEHSTPIDLYEESQAGSTEEHPEAGDRVTTEARRPAENGDRDEPAISAGEGRLDQVLGW